MQVRCPYCQAVFAPSGRNRCPSCGKTALLPGYFKDGAHAAGESDRRARARIAGRGGVQPRLPFMGRPGALVIVVALLLLAGLPLLNRVRQAPPDGDEHRRRVAGENLMTLRVALDRWREDCGRYPLQDEGLVSLMHNPGLDGWRGPYVFELKPDPWGVRFGYRRSGDRVSVHSLGPDGLEGTVDDLRLEWSDRDAPPAPEGVYPARIARPPDSE